MDLKIIKKQDNSLLSRTEIELEANFFNEATPKTEDIKKGIASTQKVDEKLVVVKNVYGDFGIGKASVLVYVYKSEEDLKKIEPKKKGKKGTKPAEGASEEVKGEEKEEAKESLKEEVEKEEPKKE